jgi:lantibiotic modifying enzyme
LNADVPQLVDPEQHEPLDDRPWDADAARTAIARIVTDTEDAFTPDGLWPAYPADLEGDVRDGPYHGLYLGAAGVVLALDRLAGAGLVELRRDYAGTAALSLERILTVPEFEAEPMLGLLSGEAGVLLVADRLAPSSRNVDRLLRCVIGNAENPALDLLYGGPGTMLAARVMLLRHGDERLADAWRASAEWLLAQWRDDLWEQVLPGNEPARYVGPGHGFAANVRILLAGRELLGEERAAAVEARAVEVVKRLAVRDGDVAQWPPRGGPKGPIRTQWCHGAPGMVISFRDVAPGDDELTELLVAGGELTWRAGPLAKGPGLCHGTAGNAYAFLALHERTGEERWLDRARRFVAHAAGQAERRDAGRYSLFTGDLGVALALAACLDPDARFPVVDLL